MPARYRIGADENGLGPVLGPLVVTAVLARVTDEGERTLRRRPRGALARRLGDSKQLLAHGHVSLGEAWARALAARAPGGEGGALTPDALLYALALDPRTALREPCPPHVSSQCWSAEGERFVAGEDEVSRARADLERLERAGVAVVGARCAIVCTKRLHQEERAGRHRLVVDLHAMERLVLALRELAGEEVIAVCGKVGGFDRYADSFGPLGGRLHVAVEEGRARSVYRLPGLGELSFVRDADAKDLLVSLASLVGKYVRELLMARIVRYYRAERPDLPDASGYRDPVTRRFILATAPLRAARGVPQICFERAPAGSAPKTPPG